MMLNTMSIDLTSLFTDSYRLPALMAAPQTFGAATS